MALKILLADDSMTAQNMGKKILVDAGYDVTAVSNGAAALKKIAELRPDLVVLDIYMPGYTGLEVCERVKNAPETAKMPVLLTVGKMEPYRAEDGARVLADGVIIKPFEATDLIAAVAKLSEMAAPAPVSAAPEIELTEEDFEGLGTQPWSPEAPSETEEPQATSAFAAMMAAPAMMDELPVEAPASMPEFDVAKPFSFAAQAEHAEEIAPPAFEMAMAAAPMYYEDEHPVAAVEEKPAAVEAPSFAYEAQPVSEEMHVGVEPVVEAGALEIAAPEELEFTCAPQVGEVEFEQESGLEPTPEAEQVVIADVQDPVLATAAEDFSDFVTHVGESNPEPATVGIFSAEEELLPEKVAAADAVEASEELPAAPEWVAGAPVAEELVVQETAGIEPVMVSEAPIAVEQTVGEVAAVEPDLLSELAEVPTEAPATEPKAWSAEETAVLPAESMALLEEEMQQAFANAPVVEEPVVEAPVVEAAVAEAKQEEVAEPAEPALEEVASLAAPVEGESVEHGVEEQVVVSAPELVEEVPAPVEAVEAVAPEVASDEDREFEAAVQAALNEAALSEDACPLVSEVKDEVSEPESIAEEVVAVPDASVEEEPLVDALADAEELTVPELAIEPVEAGVHAEETCEAQGAEVAMAAAAGAGASVDASRIATVVQRVFDRYRQQMIEEIARELSEDGSDGNS